MTDQSVTDYIAAQPASARSVLNRVRATIRKALPRAAESISYRIPTYKVDGAMVLYFAGHQHHYAIYPTTPQLIRALGKELEGHIFSRTIRFPFAEPVPAALITRIAKLRAAEAAELALAKAAKKVTKKAPKKVTPRKAKPTPPAKTAQRAKPGKRRKKKA